MQLSFSSFGGMIASNIYRTQDAPRYVLGRRSSLALWLSAASNVVTRHSDALEIGFMALGIILVPVMVFLYMRINKQHEEIWSKERTEGSKWTPGKLRRLGDRAPDFRYTL